MLTRSSFPGNTSSVEHRPLATSISKAAADSKAEPRALSKNRHRSAHEQCAPARYPEGISAQSPGLRVREQPWVNSHEILLNPNGGLWLSPTLTAHPIATRVCGAR